MGKGCGRKLNVLFLESKNSKLEFSTPENFWNGNLQVAPRRHGGGQGSRREIIFVFLKLKNSKLEFSTSENFGTEICGSHPGGMGMGQGRGGKLKFFLEFEKFEIKNFKPQKTLERNFWGRPPGAWAWARVAAGN